MNLDFSAAVPLLQAGGLCIYPTETFFALGCDACNPKAVAELLAHKERPPTQGLPVIIGHLEQLPQVCRLEARPGFPAPLRDLALELMARYWPGPLSLVLPAAPGLAPGVTSGGTVALRLTPHPAAQALCRAVGAPLVASSANLRGAPPQTQAQNLNPELVALCGGVLDLPPSPGGGLASTLARPELSASGVPVLRILRSGALSPELLEQSGYPLLPLQEGAGTNI